MKLNRRPAEKLAPIGYNLNGAFSCSANLVVAGMHLFDGASAGYLPQTAAGLVFIGAEAWKALRGHARKGLLQSVCAIEIGSALLFVSGAATGDVPLMALAAIGAIGTAVLFVPPEKWPLRNHGVGVLEKINRPNKLAAYSDTPIIAAQIFNGAHGNHLWFLVAGLCVLRAASMAIAKPHQVFTPTP